jgi:hypothetical protein
MSIESLFMQAFFIVLCALLIGCFVEKKMNKS